MLVQSFQFNTKNNTLHPSLKQKKEHKSYLEASNRIITSENVKPLPGEGHLIHDSATQSVKYFFKDIDYDFKSIKNSYKGTANDHQMGKLNDIGLKLAGISIASYLASQTTNPKARLMEFVGLGAFLLSMSLFPKIAINTPARIMHGFDIDKEYIDDQGRKKVVLQDPNYIPMDLYRGEYKSEDLDIIGDRMGIPRNVVNRHDIIKEQMRKIATQNNTLWMLTAAVTPAMAGLLCCALEQPVSSGLAKYRNTKFDNKINEIFKTTSDMKEEISSLKENVLSKDISKILEKYIKDGSLPQEEFEHIASIITYGLDNKTQTSLRNEMRIVFETAAGKAETNAYFNNENIDELLQNTRKSLKARKSRVDKIMPSAEELKGIISEIKPNANFNTEVTLKISEISKLKDLLEQNIEQKISKEGEASKIFLQDLKTDLVTSMTKNIKTKKQLVVNNDVFEKINNLAKIIGDFKTNQSVIDKCRILKFANAPETIIAHYSGKFERALLDELNFTQKELVKIRDSADYAQNIIKTRLAEIANDEIRYNRTVKNLADVIAEMENALHGGTEENSVLRKLINAIENNSNTTAKRLTNLDGVFKETVKNIINDDVRTIGNNFDTESLFRGLLEGTLENARNGNHKKEIAGVGSYRNLQLANIAERYQGTVDSFFRTILALDFNKRSLTPSTFAPELLSKHNSEKYVEHLIEAGKDIILNANSADYMNKLHTINNGEYFKDIIRTIFRVEYPAGSNMAKGILTQATENAVGNNVKRIQILEKIKRYMGRCFEIIPNNLSDYTKVKTHIIDKEALAKFDKLVKTDKSFFDLIGQETTELIRGAADRRYGTRKWLSIMSGITASVFAITYLAQLSFGKLSNPRNMKMQVEDDTNS